jgi:hypothetical protein
MTDGEYDEFLFEAALAAADEWVEAGGADVDSDEFQSLLDLMDNFFSAKRETDASHPG